MLTRTTTMSLSGRASAQRRQRRRSSHAALYCATNGCASFLQVDAEAGVATCPICGYFRRIG